MWSKELFHSLRMTFENHAGVCVDEKMLRKAFQAECIKPFNLERHHRFSPLNVGCYKLILRR